MHLKADKNMKYLGVNLTKSVQDLKSKRQNMLKEIKYICKQRDIICSHVRGCNSVKMSFLPKLIQRSNTSQTKSKQGFEN